MTYHSSIGALSSDSTQATAEAAAAASPAQYVVVLIDRMGRVAQTKTYATRASMYADWDANYFNKLDGNISFGLLRAKPEDETDMTVNPIFDVTSLSRIDWKSATPWIIGGALVIAAAVYLRKKPKRAARRRARPSYRRRTVTVWR